MRKSKTLARLRNDETVRMCCLGHFVPSFVKQAAHFGFDCIWLDLEHRYIDHANVMTLLAHSHLHDIDIMVRPPTLEKTGLYRYLEDGAAGLMIPHVNTAEKSEIACRCRQVSAARRPWNRCCRVGRRLHALRRPISEECQR